MIKIEYDGDRNFGPLSKSIKLIPHAYTNKQLIQGQTQTLAMVTLIMRSPLVFFSINLFLQKFLGQHRSLLFPFGQQTSILPAIITFFSLIFMATPSHLCLKLGFFFSLNKCINEKKTESILKS